MKWASSHMNHRKPTNMATQGEASETTNQQMNSRGNSLASAQNEPGDTGQRPLYDSSIVIENISSIVNIQQSSDMPHNRTKILTYAMAELLLDQSIQGLLGKMSNDGWAIARKNR